MGFSSGAFGIGAMHGLAVVPQSLLGESFRVAAGLGTFRPSVAVAVQSNAGDAKLAASLPQTRWPDLRPAQWTDRETTPHRRSMCMNTFKASADQMHQHRHAGLLAGGSTVLFVQSTCSPRKAGNVALASSQVPAKADTGFYVPASPRQQ